MTEPMMTPVPVQPVQPIQPIARPARKGGGASNLVLLVAGLVAAAGIAFAVGRTTAPATTAGTFDPAAVGAGPNASFAPGARGAGGFGGSMTLTGTVTAVDGTKLTITTSGGQTVTVDTSGATYHSQAAASATDVTAGTSVQVAVSGMGGPAMMGSAPNASPGTTGTSTTATDVTIVAGN